MRSILVLVFIAVSGVVAFPVFAETTEAKPQHAMQYTRIREAPPETDQNQQHIKLKTIKAEEEEKKEEDKPSTRIWNKYKALAAGKPEADADKDAEEEKAVEEEKTADAEKKKAEEEAEIEKEPARPTGIAAIIDEYRKNKAQRSQMRTINVTKPEGYDDAQKDAKKDAPAAKEKPES